MSRAAAASRLLFSRTGGIICSWENVPITFLHSAETTSSQDWAFLFYSTSADNRVEPTSNRRRRQSRKMGLGLVLVTFSSFIRQMLMMTMVLSRLSRPFSLSLSLTLSLSMHSFSLMPYFCFSRLLSFCYSLVATSAHCQFSLKTTGHYH